MAKKEKKGKKEPKVEKVFKGKKDKSAEVVSEEVISEEVKKTSDVDDFLGVEAPQEDPNDKLSENQKNKLEKINAVKSKISKILQSSNIEIVDENFGDEYESSDAPGVISQEDLDSLKSMYGAEKNKKAEVTLTIDDFDYMYVGQYLEEYDLMHMKNIKRVKIQRKKNPKLRKFLTISAMVVVLALGGFLAFFFTRKIPVYLKSVTLNQTAREYYVNDEFQERGLYFIAEYSDGSIQKIGLEKSHFNSDLSTGRFERVGDEEKEIIFISNGTANLVFSYGGFNVSYEVTVKKKHELGFRAIYSSGVFDILAGGLITQNLLMIAVNYEDLGFDIDWYSTSSKMSLYVDVDGSGEFEECKKLTDGYLVESGTNQNSAIEIRYSPTSGSTYKIVLDKAQNDIYVEFN